jgi:hypothetical protein
MRYFISYHVRTELRVSDVGCKGYRDRLDHEVIEDLHPLRWAQKQNERHTESTFTLLNWIEETAGHGFIKIKDV